MLGMSQTRARQGHCHDNKSKLWNTILWNNRTVLFYKKRKKAYFPAGKFLLHMYVYMYNVWEKLSWFFIWFFFVVCFLPVGDFNPWTSTPTHSYSITDVKHQPFIAIKTQETAINVAFKFLYFNVSHFFCWSYSKASWGNKIS